MIEYLDALTVNIAHIVDKEPVLLVFDLCSLDIKVNFFADHHLRQSGFVRLCGHDRADVFTFSENGNLVGNLHNLVELMSDYYN